MAARINHEVAGLDVAMDDAVAMGVVERIRHISSDAHDFAHWHWPSQQPVAETLSLDILHGDPQ